MLSALSQYVRKETPKWKDTSIIINTGLWWVETVLGFSVIICLNYKFSAKTVWYLE